jgi:nucleoid DNA-binding protein
MAKKASKSSAKPAAKAAPKAAALPKPAKLVQAAKPRKKTELFSILADHTGVTKKQVAGVFEALGKVMAVDLAKPSASAPRVFVVPGMMKVVARFKPAQPAKKGKNPFTGEEIMVKAKPASTALRIRPLKALKAMI